MAKEANAESGLPNGDAPAKSGMMGMILGLGLATLIAGGAGAGYAFYVQKKSAAPEQAAKPAREEPAAASKGKEGEMSGLLALQPIITNLAAPPGMWIRLESSVMVEGLPTKDVETLRKDVTEDVLAFLRTLTLPQVEGPMGLLHLKEDLNDRVAVRSKGKAREVVIQTMVLQ